METLRELWAAGGTSLGAWLTIPSSISAEGAARVGTDYVCVDNQHGAIDYQATVGMIQAIELGGSRPIVRVPWNEPGIIGKMLDAGAQGIVVPMVNTAEAARAVVSACLYAPDGTRSHGPLLAGMRTERYQPEANQRLAPIPMIETVEALRNLDEILAVPGVTAIYVGPADLSLSLGLAPGNNDGQEPFDEALATIVAACRRTGVVPGIHATGALAGRRLEQGFRMITIAGDMLAMRTKIAEELAEARGARPSGGPGSMY